MQNLEQAITEATFDHTRENMKTGFKAVKFDDEVIEEEVCTDDRVLDEICKIVQTHLHEAKNQAVQMREAV